MIKSVFAKKDTTLYKDIPELNSGLDEIIELRKSLTKINAGSVVETTSATASLSRILIKFDITDISSSVASGKIVNPTYYLKLSTTEAKSIQLDYSVEAWAVSQSWSMGSGRKHSNPVISNGAAWNYLDATNPWSGSLPVTASLQGATWFTEYSASQSFSYESTDILMDVSHIVKAWISQSIPNEGFILKFPQSLETDSNEYGILNFFSRDTNTIYPPLLQVKWDDSSYSTGSLVPVDINSMLVSCNSVRDKYKSAEVARINMTVRDRYPAKYFVTSSRYLQTKSLPTSSYYAVKDAYTEEYLVPFDTGSTKISCNASGSYFNFDMSGLQPERYYKFVLKIENSNNTIIIDDKFYFKVER